MFSTHKEIGFLFDLDGVLIDSESEYSRIWALINKEFPTGIDNLEQVIKGCTLSKILAEYYPLPHTAEKVSERLHELENQMHYEYLPHAKNFLISLKENMIPCALVTSSDDEKMKHLREEIEDIFDFFDFIVTGNLVSTSKPSPEGYLLAASKLEKDPRKCAVFEDSLQGVMAGENAGAFVVGITGTLPAETIHPHADLIVNHLGEVDLNHLLQELLQR